MTTPETLSLLIPPARRQARLRRAAQVCSEALAGTLRDLRSAADVLLGPATERLIVFRVEPGEEQPRLHSVEFAAHDQLVVRGQEADDRAACTELHADLVQALSRWTGEFCPSGLAVAIDQLMIAGYFEGHCSHWDGEPAFALSLVHHGLFDDAPESPYCCPSHLIPELADRYGLQLPTRRTPHDCDDEA